MYDFRYLLIMWSFLMASNPVYSADSKLDSLKSLLEQTSDDNHRIDILLKMASLTENAEGRTDIYLEALELSKKLGVPEQEAYCLRSLALVSYYQGQYGLAVDYWSKALEIYKQENNLMEVSRNYSNIGAVYFNQGNHDKALENYLASQKAAERINDSIRLATVYTNIGAVYGTNKLNFSKALKYDSLALRILEVVEDSSAIGILKTNMAEILWDQGMTNQAINYFHSARGYLEGSIDEPYALAGLVEIYISTRDLDSAYSYALECLRLARKYDSKMDEAHALRDLSYIYECRKQPDLAIANLLQAEQLSLAIYDFSGLRNIYVSLSELYANRGEFEKGLTYYRKASAMKDSVFSADLRRKLDEKLFDFEIEKKQDEITILSQEREVQASVIRRQKTVQYGTAIASAFILLFALVFYRQRNRIKKEKTRSDELLLTYLPTEVAEELKEKGRADARDFEMVSILFTDFKGFTERSAKLSAADLVNEINHCFEAFDHIIEKYGIEKIKTIGDAYMAAGGLPVPGEDSVKNTVLAALEMQEFIEARSQKLMAKGQPHFQMRVGIHTGPVVAGIVGVKKFQYDVWGDTVNTASRIESAGEVGKVNISQATYELLRDPEPVEGSEEGTAADPTQFSFESRGKIEVKGKGEMEMWFVQSL